MQFLQYDCSLGCHALFLFWHRWMTEQLQQRKSLAKSFLLFTSREPRGRHSNLVLHYESWEWQPKQHHNMQWAHAEWFAWITSHEETFCLSSAEDLKQKEAEVQAAVASPRRKTHLSHWRVCVCVMAMFTSLDRRLLEPVFNLLLLYRTQK